MKNHFFLLGMLITLLALSSRESLPGATTTNTPPAPAANTVSIASTNVVITPSVKKNADDEEDADDNGHSIKMEFDTKHGDRDSGPFDEIVSDLIPLAGITATFGTPILIVLIIAYFNFRRRRENLALAREFLSKGQPVPAELLDPALKGLNYGDWKSKDGSWRSDLRKGFRLTFIGLGVSLALYVNSPHSTTWGWGLIPAVMGIGFLISGWLESRSKDPRNVAVPPPPHNPEKPL